MENVVKYFQEIMTIVKSEEDNFRKKTSDYFDFVKTFAKIESDHNEELACFNSNKFNYFKYVHVDENLITDIIAEMLDIKGAHGQKELFLNLFLELLLIPLPFNKPPSSITREVRTIQHINALRKMDILIDWIEGYGIMIENKPKAYDQDKQLKDYSENLINRYGTANFLMIYLSNGYPSEKSIPKEELDKLILSKQFLHITYQGGFNDWLKNCINSCQSEKYKWFLKDFLAYTLNNYI